MAIMRAKEVIEIFSKLDPNEIVWITWSDKKEVINFLLEADLTDKDDNPYEKDRIEQIVDDNFMLEVKDQLGNEDSLWEKFSESYDEIVRELFLDEIRIIEENEIEKELWDKE